MKEKSISNEKSQKEGRDRLLTTVMIVSFVLVMHEVAFILSAEIWGYPWADTDDFHPFIVALILQSIVFFLALCFYLLSQPKVILQIWKYLRSKHLIGPSLGFPHPWETLRLSDLSKAMPAEPPSSDLLPSPEIYGQLLEGGLTWELKRANLWAAALEKKFKEESRYKKEGTILTTYGFARVNDKLKLSVIQYLKPSKFIWKKSHEKINLGGWEFPIILRPWLVEKHGPRLGSDGTCRVTYRENDNSRCSAILTSLHALLPKEASIGDSVRPAVSRESHEGTLKKRSQTMDAAIVAIDEIGWDKRSKVDNSSIVGFKPVVFASSLGEVRGEIIEHSGYSFATIPAQPDGEPPKPVHLIFNCSLAPGDSGCLGFDLEFESVSNEVRPYLLYQGVMGFNSLGNAGYGLMLEQPKRIWDLEFFQ